MENVVHIATRTIGARTVTGHFLTADAIPEGWTPAEPPTRDITHVIQAFHSGTKESIVRLMNAHWQE